MLYFVTGRLDYIENGKVALQVHNNSRDARAIPITPDIIIMSFSILTCIEVDLPPVAITCLYSAISVLLGYDSEHHMEVNEH